MICLWKQCRFPAADNGVSRGSILLIALWSIFLLSAFAVVLGYEVRQKLTLVSRLELREKSFFAAQAGVLKGIAELKKEGPVAIVSLKDKWNNNPEFNGLSIGEAKADIRIVDEERKININRADFTVLSKVFQSILKWDQTRAAELAACVVDWRDADDALTLPAGSAETAYYKELPHPYAAKNADFEVLDELLFVRGMDTCSYAKVMDYVTIYGNGKVNINTASKEVLMALGLDEDISDKILAFRSGRDKIEGTDDDNVFVSAAEIISGLASEYTFSEQQKNTLSEVIVKYLDTKSANFTIDVTVGIHNRPDTGKVSCVVTRMGKILYWQVTK